MAQQLTLYKTLEQLLIRLEDKGIINSDDRNSLLNDAVDHVKQALGNEPTPEELKKPEMLMKLTTALVATHVMRSDPTQKYTFDFNLLFKNPMQSKEVKEEIQKLLTKFVELDPQAAQNFTQLIVNFAQEILEFEKNLDPDMRPSPQPGKNPMADIKNYLHVLCDGEGNVIGVFTGEFTSNKNNAVDTVSSLLSAESELLVVLEQQGNILENLDTSLAKISDSFFSIERAPRPSPQK